MQRLRQTLSELNPIFWNPKVDHQLKKSNYPNQSPIESAKYRYVLVLRNHKKKHLESLLKRVEECLSPYDKVFEVLLDEFPSRFAKQVLLTHQNLIENFYGISRDNYELWTELLVCMSYKDFWADLASKQPAETEQDTTLAKGWGIKRITGWIFKKTSHFILTVIVTILATVIAAIVVDIFADFGWIARMKTFFLNILTHK